MILIADSGSTKTDWRLISGTGEIHSFHSEGINPYFHTSASIAETLHKLDFAPFSKNQISELYFYSAGSSTPHNKKIMKDGFEPVFREAKVLILHDLLGAARALFQDGTGIAGILGTGSNSCLFLDGKVDHTLGGHGYILGDEGSGMHIGRKVVRDFMSDLMPPEVAKSFQKRYKLSKDDITDAVYKQLFPNRFLASFSTFVYDNLPHQYFLDLANDAFMKYFERYIIQFPNFREYSFRIVGSVGFYFSDLIHAQAEKYEVKLDKIIKAPIDGLIEYHSPDAQ